MLEWVAISFSSAGKWKVKVKSLSRVQLLATLWTAAYQAPPSMGFSRQEYWSGVPLPSPLTSLSYCYSLFFVCFLISVIYFSPVEIWFSCSFGGSDGKESTCNEGDPGLIPWLGRSPGGGHGNPLQNSFLETPHGQTNLVGYNPWGRKESETTEWLRTHLFSISFISKFNMINL